MLFSFISIGIALLIPVCCYVSFKAGFSIGYKAKEAPETINIEKPKLPKRKEEETEEDKQLRAIEEFTVGGSI